ncbi:MAG: trigger factor, partial [Lachnospiraceae bacterium]|nr:trigger factor [Lachnospiraceae bacterium]
ELDDEFASEVSEFETLEEYRQDIRRQLHYELADKMRKDKEEAVLEAIIENATMDIPLPMIQMYADQLMDDMSNRMRMSGISLETYSKYLGITMEMMKEEMTRRAKKTISSDIVLRAIAQSESIEVTDEELEERLEQIAQSSKMEVEQARTALGDKWKENISVELRNNKALKLVTDNAIEVVVGEEDAPKTE